MSVLINNQAREVRKCATNVKNLPLLFHAFQSAKFCPIAEKNLIAGSDIESMERLDGIKQDVELWSRASVSAIGVLLALVDHEELNHGELQSIGWLLSGLGGLQDVLSESSVSLDETLAHLKEQKALEKPADIKKPTE